jgi:hypothetical protein
VRETVKFPGLAELRGKEGASWGPFTVSVHRFRFRDDNFFHLSLAVIYVASFCALILSGL